jgi:hypothetical protein
MDVLLKADKKASDDFRADSEQIDKPEVSQYIHNRSS